MFTTLQGSLGKSVRYGIIAGYPSKDPGYISQKHSGHRNG